MRLDYSKASIKQLQNIAFEDNEADWTHRTAAQAELLRRQLQQVGR